MTKEELLDLLGDEDIQDAIYHIAENVGAAIFGEATESYTRENPKTHKCEKKYRSVPIAELLQNIVHAIYMIGE